LRAALVAAMRSRDHVAIAALRSTLGTIDNAESVDVVAQPLRDGPIAGAVEGLGAAEVPRRVLLEQDVASIVWAELRDRQKSAEEYDRLGQPEVASRLRAEAQILREQL
jgi:uncharacterized protein